MGKGVISFSACEEPWTERQRRPEKYAFSRQNTPSAYGCHPAKSSAWGRKTENFK